MGIWSGTGQVPVQKCAASRDLCVGEGPAKVRQVCPCGILSGLGYMTHDNLCSMGRWQWLCTSYTWGSPQQDLGYNSQIVRTEQSEGVCIVMVLQANELNVLLFRITCNASCLQVISAMPASCCVTLVFVPWGGTSCFPAGIFPILCVSVNIWFYKRLDQLNISVCTNAFVGSRWLLKCREAIWRAWPERGVLPLHVTGWWCIGTYLSDTLNEG